MAAAAAAATAAATAAAAGTPEMGIEQFGAGVGSTKKKRFLARPPFLLP